ncbi:hypothetical protein J7E68_02645 [Microbacterium sp. ISL-103]|jgi:hypothetical protein|uniref:hypothetical protein n=1 Tax=Microbacterium sp. ISL-103 TaxID=2819156 RepID=UPI001BE5D572|nr:hypothetical protein [Microbacterium sp. ISL-103]MBT2473500.1 hypothetical protein [Microbacterium sp. ISL-103]
MNEIELDALLREAAPIVTVPNDLTERRTAVLAKGRKRQGRARVGIAGAVASVLLLGGGTMAVAGGDHMTPWGWMADNSFTIERPAGGNCFVGMRIEWDGVAEDDPMVQDAKTILNSIELQSLDIADVLAEARTSNENAPAISKQTEDELRMQAMFSVASEMTFDELIARGYEMRVGHEVSISAESTACR